MTFALNENIKRLRLAQKMSQVDFGKQLGVTKQCVSNWENDNVLPSIDMLVKIANLFKVSTDYLLGRESSVLLDVSELTETQRGHISLLVNDLAEKNKSKLC